MKHNKDNDYLKSLGTNIRRIRRLKSITMETLAYDANIEYRQLGRIERGEINTSVLSLLKLSECLGVDIADLFKF